MKGCEKIISNRLTCLLFNHEINNIMDAYNACYALKNYFPLFSFKRRRAMLTLHPILSPFSPALPKSMVTKHILICFPHFPLCLLYKDAKAYLPMNGHNRFRVAFCGEKGRKHVSTIYFAKSYLLVSYCCSLCCFHRPSSLSSFGQRKTFSLQQHLHKRSVSP